jgi:hypothetical protein
MKYTFKRHTVIIVLALFCLVIIFTLLVLPKAIAPNDVGPNYKNVTVHTNLTITHSKPDVLNVTIYEALNMSNKNITITAGSTKKIYCNATVRSWEGFNDITLVNATLYHVSTSSHNATDNFNNHYTNSSCIINSSLNLGAPFTGWFVCSFDVLYYSNNGTWNCNVTVSNSYTSINSNFTGSGNATTLFYPVYALNVTDGIDYGGVAVEDYSAPDRTANITNLGNMGINISVEGYGTRKNDGLAMNCSVVGNISVENERFSASSGQSYGAKTSLVSTSGGINIPGLTMPKQINSTLVQNATYWQIYIPPNPAGNCTGFVIFTAVAP